jgi:hypothetical protein
MAHVIREPGRPGGVPFAVVGASLTIWVFKVRRECKDARDFASMAILTYFQGIELLASISGVEVAFCIEGRRGRWVGTVDRNRILAAVQIGSS